MRSRMGHGGRLSRKDHYAVIVDALGNLIRFVLLPGQRHDIISFDALMAGIHCLAACQLPSCSSAVVYIGYAFSDGIDEYIYWFPVEMVVDPFTGAVEYVPVT
jgi:hypothetical protein